MLDLSVKSVRLEEIMDYINPEVAFIKVDSEGKDCMVSTIYRLCGRRGIAPIFLKIY